MIKNVKMPVKTIFLLTELKFLFYLSFFYRMLVDVFTLKEIEPRDMILF
jgi:hypothetical protein